MKKKLTLLLACALTAIMALTLVACNFSGGGFGGGSTGGNKQNNTNRAENKSSFETVNENYAKIADKTVVSDGTVRVTMYTPDTSDPSNPAKSGFGVKVTLKRVSEGDKDFARVRFVPYETDESFTGLLNGISQAIDALISGKGSLIAGMLDGVTKLSPEAKAALPEFKKGIDFCYDFLNEKIDITAAYGKEIDHNLIAEYRHPADNEYRSKWVGMKDETFAAVFGREFAENVKDGFMDSFTMAMVNRKDLTGSDILPIQKDDDGKSHYEFELKTNGVYELFVNALEQGFDALGILKAAVPEDLRSGFMTLIKNSARVKTGKIHCATDVNEKPTYYNTDILAEFNLDVAELTDFVISLHRAGVIDSQSTEIINTALTLIAKRVCSTSGKKGVIGMSIKIGLKEAFAYEKKDYDLSKIDNNLFIPISESAEGRISAEESLSKVLTDAETAFDTLFEGVSDEAKAAIINAAKTAISAYGIIELFKIGDFDAEKFIYQIVKDADKSDLSDDDKNIINAVLNSLKSKYEPQTDEGKK